MKSMLMLISDGFEDIEAMGTVDILRRCGVRVEICSAAGRRQITSARNITVICDSVLEQYKIDVLSWDGVILPGGQPNADTLRDNTSVVEYVREFYRENKLCCAICAAPIVLEKAGLIEGKHVTSYPGCLLDESKCIFTGASVSVDGNLITGRGPGVTCDFAFKICEALGLEEKAEEVRAAMMFAVSKS